MTHLYVPDPVITCIANRADWLEEMARAYSGEAAALLERRILEGENRIDLPYQPDVLAGRKPPRRVSYRVPSWWRRPVERAKVELARWQWRRRRPVDPTCHTTVQHAPQALDEVDLRGVPTTTQTAAAWGRRRIREYELLHLPVEFPVKVLYTGVDGRDYVAMLP